MILVIRGLSSKESMIHWPPVLAALSLANGGQAVPVQLVGKKKPKKAKKA